MLGGIPPKLKLVPHASIVSERLSRCRHVKLFYVTNE